MQRRMPPDNAFAQADEILGRPTAGFLPPVQYHDGDPTLRYAPQRPNAFEESDAIRDSILSGLLLKAQDSGIRRGRQPRYPD